jgi:predicted ABC-type ATPase
MKISEAILNEGVHDNFNFKAIFLVGSPGSGKTTIEKEFGLETRGFKQLDIDRTKLHLKTLSDYETAGKTTEKRFNLWANDYLGLIINTTGRNADVIIRLNKKLKECYYQTFMIFVDVDESIARARIESRYQTALDRADKRKVDLDYFQEAYSSVKQNIALYELLFGRYFSLVQNNENMIDQDLDIARRKLNNFLLSPNSPEAQSIMKGVKTKAIAGIGRKYPKLSGRRP